MIAQTLSANTVKDIQKEKVFDWTLLLTTAMLILCGSFTYSIYPPPVNAVALALMVGLFYNNLHRHDLVSFFLQLFIGNFFIFGIKFGGNYNISAFASIVFYMAINGKITFTTSSVLDKSIKTALLLWLIMDFLSVTGGNTFPAGIELQNFFAFGMMLFLFYFLSKMPLTENNIYKIILIICIFFSYEFIVAVNQKYVFYYSPFPFFPNIDENIEFDLNIVRSGSTLNNFEAFAEFCASLIGLLLPGILSGSSLKKNKFYFYLSLFTILIALISIVLSGTRSSILLLPMIFISAVIMLGKRLKSRIIVLLIVGSTGLFLLNNIYTFIDTSVFQERTEESVDFQHMTLESIINGDQLNRGGLFPYAMDQVKKTNPFIGRGYFVSPDEYRLVHFGKEQNNMAGVSDYHNLYMSSYVMWGPWGFLCMMFLFIHSLVAGWKTYWSIRKKDHFTTDTLLGFNILFLFLLVNQFKIQFIRDINYFTIILLMLVFYISLTKYVKQGIGIK